MEREPEPGRGTTAGTPAQGLGDVGWAQGCALFYRDDAGSLQVVSLEPVTSVTIGRGSGCDLRISWDESVSRVHAELVRVGQHWTVVDDGLSRNGTFLNGERVNGRRRLHDGDTFVVGDTSFSFRDIRAGTSQLTSVQAEVLTTASLSPTQRNILTSLCRPYKQEGAYATPASNLQIAGELFLSVDAVKTQLRTLFQKFHIEDLPQNQKRAKLVERAFALGLVTRRDL
jgi:pSer/pThr/pTyr-binding forkhead associated (FHA) protein